jgi:hypothetical protein
MPADQVEVLNYIDKLHSLQTESGKAINRTYALLLGFCLLTVAVSSGMAVADTKFTIIGLNVAFPSWAPPYIGAWLVFILYVQLLSFVSHENRLRETILALYKEIGFEHDSLKSRQVNLLEYPNVVNLIASSENLPLGFIDALVTLMLVVLILISPLIAQGYVAFRMLATHGPRWWLICSFLLIFVFMIVYLVAFVRWLLGAAHQIVGREAR